MVPCKMRRAISFPIQMRQEHSIIEEMKQNISKKNSTVSNSRISSETAGYTWSRRKSENQNEANPVLSKLYIFELLYLQDI